MFSRQRKARVLFGLSDIVLTALAFEAAYQTRSLLPLDHAFFMLVPLKALVLGIALFAWVTAGVWLGVYEKLDSGHLRVIDEIIFAVESESLAELEEVFLMCDEEGVRTRVAVDFFPHVNSTVSLDRLGPTPLLTFSAAPYDEIRLLIKRLIDIGIAAA